MISENTLGAKDNNHFVEARSIAATGFYQPLVSIVMPTYNRASLIGQSIESILKQSYSNWELFVIDDGSEDDTESIVGSYCNKKIRYFNAGRVGIGGRIKNIGMSMCNGELIAFLDSDDLWSSEKLLHQVIALDRNGEASFCLCGGYNFTNTNSPIDYFYRKREGFLAGNLFLDCFRSNVTTFSQALLFRKKCLEVTGGFDENGSFSDADFIISLCRHYQGIILYDLLVFRRIHEENYIHANWQKSYQEGINIIAKNKKFLPLNTTRLAYYQLYLNYGEKCIRYNYTTRAIINFFKAWQNKVFSWMPLRKTGKAVLYSFRNFYK